MRNAASGQGARAEDRRAARRKDPFFRNATITALDGPTRRPDTLFGPRLWAGSIRALTDVWPQGPWHGKGLSVHRLWFALLAVAVALAVLAFSAWHQLRYTRALRQRVADVAALLEAYNLVSETNASPTMPEVMQVLRNKQIFLHMPLRIDKSLDSYRIAASADALETDPQRVIVEETENVKDAKVRVVGLADGSIQFRRR